jgi:radical SAM superfamily enzyme YgiQ (UPF0313 family)
MFTSDNFNKYLEAEELLTAMTEERLGLEIFVQCDTQIARQEHLVALLARAGCFQMFVGVESFNRQTLLAASKGQNRPELYRDIVRLCRKHGIGSHFSNIIGFPQDTEEEVHGHLEKLRAIDPTVASFYILCPIPGTEQYDDFLTQGLIEEKNLDRFDGTCLTWRHPCLGRAQIARLLFQCYRSFFSRGHMLRHAAYQIFGRRNLLRELAKNSGFSLFSRYCAWEQMHPMSGGVFRVRRDGIRDFISLRKEAFGFELAPLPQSLLLSAAESRLNGDIKPRVQGRPPRIAIPPLIGPVPRAGQ